MTITTTHYADGWAVATRSAAGVNPVGDRLVKSVLQPPARPWRGFATEREAETKAQEWRTYLGKQAQMK